MNLIRKSVLAAALGAAFSACAFFLPGTAFVSYAAAPARDNLPEGMTLEQYDRLYDNVIEWDEIDHLVRYWNPTYVRTHDQLSDAMGVGELRTAYSDFFDDIEEQLDDLDDAIDSIREAQSQISQIPGSYVPMGGSVVSKDAALAALENQLTAVKEGKKQIRAGIHAASKSVKSMETGVDQKKLIPTASGTQMTMEQLERQMVSVVESLVLSYHQLAANRSMAAQQVALYESLLSTYQSMQAQNLATAAEVAACQSRLDSARQSLSQVDAGLYQLKANIALQCGYAADADVVIADMPDPDPGFLSGRNIREDREKAISSNPAVIGAGRLSGTAFYGTGFELRDQTENASIGRIGAAFDQLAADLEKQTVLYEASQTTLRKAQLTRDGAARQYALGLLGRGEYAGLEMQYISYEASAKLQALGLWQAIDSYRWALYGILSAD